MGEAEERSRMDCVGFLREGINGYDLRVRLLMACLCAVGGFYFFVENCMKI